MTNVEDILSINGRRFFSYVVVGQTTGGGQMSHPERGLGCLRDLVTSDPCTRRRQTNEQSYNMLHEF